nr:hypothetical protein 12 [Alphaproteobacteria bacterium]
MKDLLVTYWPFLGFFLVHAVGFIWAFSGLTGRVRELEKRLEDHRNVHERLAKLEATSFSTAESVRRIEAHLLRMKEKQ